MRADRRRQVLARHEPSLSMCSKHPAADRARPVPRGGDGPAQQLGVRRAVVIAPYLLSNVFAALIWLWLLDPLLGMTNAFLTLTRRAAAVLRRRRTRRDHRSPAINIWRHVGLTALLFYAGLQSDPALPVRGGPARRGGGVAGVPPHHPAAAAPGHWCSCW